MHARTLAVVALALAPSALAHEFWLLPDSFMVQPSDLVRARLFHGERFAGDIVARDDSMIERFEYVSPASPSPTPIRGLHGHPQSFLRPDQPGPGVLVYQTREYINVLPAERFEAYLIEEGLGEISSRRAAIGETGREGREAYIRCAKALIHVEASASDSSQSASADTGSVEAPTPIDSVVGLPCEIVLESFDRRAEGTALSVLVLFEGAPLADARLVAVAEARREDLIELRTDAEGRAWITADATGPWMFTTLHMTRTEGREDVDWKSYWASLTFSIEP